MTEATPKEIDEEQEVSKQVATIKAWVTRIIPLVVSVATAVTAYLGADHSAKDKAQVAKDAAESGYQAVDKWVKHFEETDAVLVKRIDRLVAEVAELRRRQAKPTTRKVEAKPAAPPPVAQAVPPPPPPLPPNLDKALEQQQAIKPAEVTK